MRVARRVVIPSSGTFKFAPDTFAEKRRDGKLFDTRLRDAVRTQTRGEEEEAREPELPEC